MNVIESTREASYDRSVESIMHSAEIFAMDMKVTDDLELDQNIYSKIVDEISGDRPEEGQVYINRHGQIALSLRYGGYCYTKSYGEESYYKEKTEGDCITPFYYLNGQKYSNQDIAFLEGPLLRSQIAKIVTLSTNVVPEDALGSWDVGVDTKGNIVPGKIMAWYKESSETDSDGNTLYEVYIGQEGGVKARTKDRLFAYLPNVTEIDLSKLDTSNMTSMVEMFAGDSKLTSLDISSFDTSKVTTMGGMFVGCENLTSLNVSSFDTSNVTDMTRTFQGCSSLTTLDLSNFDTSNVTTMYQMFQNCKSLTILNLSSFNTTNVTTMFQMFVDCQELKSLDLNNFDTSKVTTMSGMFTDCKSLTNLDLRSFNTSKAESMKNMFTRCFSLTEILVSDKWNTENANTENMFGLCGVSEVTVK